MKTWKQARRAAKVAGYDGPDPQEALDLLRAARRRSKSGDLLWLQIEVAIADLIMTRSEVEETRALLRQIDTVLQNSGGEQ